MKHTVKVSGDTGKIWLVGTDHHIRFGTGNGTWTDESGTCLGGPGCVVQLVLAADVAVSPYVGYSTGNVLVADTKGALWYWDPKSRL